RRIDPSLPPYETPTPADGEVEQGEDQRADAVAERVSGLSLDGLVADVKEDDADEENPRHAARPAGRVPTRAERQVQHSVHPGHPAHAVPNDPGESYRRGKPRPRLGWHFRFVNVLAHDSPSP